MSGRLARLVARLRSLDGAGGRPVADPDETATGDDTGDDADTGFGETPGPSRRSVADATDDDAARLAELRRQGGASDGG